MPQPTPEATPKPRSSRLKPPGRIAASETERPAPNRPGTEEPSESWFSKRADWLPTCLTVLGIGLLAFLLFSGMSKISSTLQANQQRETISTVWRQLLVANVKIQGSPTTLDKEGNLNFPYVSMGAVGDNLSLHRNLRLAGALPGVSSLSLSSDFKRTIGGAIADDNTLVLAAKTFPHLDSLDLSSTRVTSLLPVADLRVRELRLVNATIRQEKLMELGLLNTVTDVYIGWDFDSRVAENAIYTSPQYKQQVLDALASMPNLKHLYLYEMKFDSDQLKKLQGVSIQTSRN